MGYKVLNLNCPNCGAQVTTAHTQCDYCQQPITIIRTFDDIRSKTDAEVKKYANSFNKALAEEPSDSFLNASLAMCYLKLKLYDKALPAFEKAMDSNPDNADVFFYAAVCMLKGKKPFLMHRNEIDKIEEYINAALMIEERGLYYYFLAYIKYDYFNRKFFNTSPTYQEALNKAAQAGCTRAEADELFKQLGVDKPVGF